MNIQTLFQSRFIQVIIRAMFALLMLSTFSVYAYVDPVAAIIKLDSKKHRQTCFSHPSLLPTNNFHGLLARVTYYYRGEDSYSAQGKTSTGQPLRRGVCAVDPNRIPFYSSVHLNGIGTYLALDSGTAVVSRKAALLSARTKEERNAIVVDIYCSSRSEAHRMELSNPLYVAVNWNSSNSRD